ncbi:hypothetical protein AVHM3334_07315 [Acidovorax sp. SUPP3334]|nr:hypothetical protein AVHM3334_07315 [Acidovorax sp. SUPP3334]
MAVLQVRDGQPATAHRRRASVRTEQFPGTGAVVGQAGLKSSVEPAEGVITCNIGDMLTRWSDDQLPSNFHRVRNPLPHEYQGARYSLAFFCQANEDAVVEGPGRKYPAIQAGEYLRQRITANFARY